MKRAQPGTIAVFVVGAVERFGHNAGRVENAMADTMTQAPTVREVRGANLCQALHWLASGRLSAVDLCTAYLAAIERDNPRLNAYVHVAADVREQAHDADARRARGVFGRLDGVPIAIKDYIDVAGMPTRCGLPAVPPPAARDARVVERLRCAGAVILGKTHVPDCLSASSTNEHTGAAHNPWRHGFQAGGSSAGSAVAVAAGLAAAAIGTDSLGSIRIPASYCGVYALKPTHGQISTCGMVPGARRLDCIGLMGRGVDDLGVLLHSLGGYDAEDPCSRRGGELAFPDWEPGSLRCGVLADLAVHGVEPAVEALFEQALDTLRLELGTRRRVEFAGFSLARARRAGFFLIEAEMLVSHAAALADADHPVSPGLRAQMDYARGRSAADYVAADRVLDAAVLQARHLFGQVDVLVTPTTPQAAFPLDAPLPENQGDFTAFANLSGCPAVSIPMGLAADRLPVGLQFLGPPGSDLRLLELAEVCAAALDATPSYPIGEDANAG